MATAGSLRRGASAFAEAAHTLRFGDSEGETHTPITAAQLLHLRRAERQRKRSLADV